MMSFSHKYELACFLRSYGVKLIDIARHLYPEIANRKLDAQTYMKYMKRVWGLINYARKKEEQKRLAEDSQFLDKTVFRSPRTAKDSWHVGADGTLSVKERKRLSQVLKPIEPGARDNYKYVKKIGGKLYANITWHERIVIEVEQLIYYFYEAAGFKVIDWHKMTMWSSIKKIFKKTWPKLLEKHEVIYYHSPKRRSIPEILAAYILLLFHHALAHYPAYWKNKDKLHQLIMIFVKNKEKFKQHLEELASIFTPLLIPKPLV